MKFSLEMQLGQDIQVLPWPFVPQNFDERYNVS